MKRWLCSLLLLPLPLMAQEDMWDDEDWGDEEEGIVWSGFAEAAYGTRLSDDRLRSDQQTLGDLRWRVETERQTGLANLAFKSDLAYDSVEEDWDIDLREFSASFSPAANVDVKIGRQVLTWGTGDLLFLNDLFPKDYVSFFAGRDDEYLKAPGNVARVTWYTGAVNVDVAWSPVFDPDIYISGERFSFYSPLAGDVVAPSPPFSAAEPDEKLSNGEFAVRLYKTVESTEYAVYGYRGFNKQPFFERMNAIGASLRRPLGPGLVNTEISHYDLDSSQTRALLGYEWEARPNFTVGLQYYVERNESAGNRQLLTNRLTYRAGRDRYTWSLFTFYSPTDDDYYLRPQFSYRHSDAWSLTAGGNLFGGKGLDTFFGQFEDATNAWLRVRYHY